MDFWSTDRCRADAQRDESGAISRETVTAVTFKPLLSVDTYTKFSSFSMDLSPQSQKPTKWRTVLTASTQLPDLR